MNDKKLSPLTPRQQQYLDAVRELEVAQQPFSYAAVGARIGLRSVGTSWQYRDALVAKGYLVDGERLAPVKCPVTTEKARRHLRKRSAA